MPAFRVDMRVGHVISLTGTCQFFFQKMECQVRHLFRSSAKCGEGKRWNEFEEWHVAWSAECKKIWKKSQRKKIKLKSKRASLPQLFLAPIYVCNCFAGPFITAGLNQKGRTESSDFKASLHSCLQ